MALNPKERADFDEIVTRLRLEDVGVGMIQPRRKSFALLVSLLGSTLVFGIGVILASRSPGAFGALLVALGVLGGLGLIWRALTHPRAR
jgi:hypothetical protein